jgi:hypothetical protein
MSQLARARFGFRRDAAQLVRDLERPVDFVLAAPLARFARSDKSLARASRSVSSFSIPCANMSRSGISIVPK